MPEDNADSEWEDEMEGDPTDGAPDSACAANWKATAKDEKKCTWSAFWETGIFASVCRHGRILWLIDMIKSGELYVNRNLTYFRANRAISQCQASSRHSCNVTGHCPGEGACRV